MYKNVLVPLDGSKLAECALPHLVNLAKDGAIGAVSLVNVVEMENPLSYFYSDDTEIWQGFDLPAFWNGLLEKAHAYLADVQARLQKEGLQAEKVVIKGGKPAPTIVEYAVKNLVDLIIIATHGQSGMIKLMFGNVALKVLHDARMPVLLIRPESCR